MEITYTMAGRKLDIGRPSRRHDGWETCDIRQGADYLCSATNVSSLGKFDELECTMVLEHLRPWEISIALYDWHEALNVGGIVDIIVPDLDDIIQLLKKNSTEALRRLFGGSLFEDGPDDSPEMEHRWAFTESTLSNELFEAGYSDAKRMESPIGILRMRAWK
jgi:predicted SAM-dependent methyltransferase